jgi:hypothetical protein
MAAPTGGVRAVTYERDRERCVSCGSTTQLEYQHRQATGMGGSKIRPGFTDGLTTCSWCNPRYEGSWQEEALRCGWKVRKWVADTAAVPVWYATEKQWYVLRRDGLRSRITIHQAIEMMVAVYGPEYLEE